MSDEFKTIGTALLLGSIVFILWKKVGPRKTENIVAGVRG